LSYESGKFALSRSHPLLISCHTALHFPFPFFFLFLLRFSILPYSLFFHTIIPHFISRARFTLTGSVASPPRRCPTNDRSFGPNRRYAYEHDSAIPACYILHNIGLCGNDHVVVLVVFCFLSPFFSSLFFLFCCVAPYLAPRITHSYCIFRVHFRVHCCSQRRYCCSQSLRRRCCRQRQSRRR
jgi:hypothetical protein